jgi:hypothetical protein
VGGEGEDGPDGLQGVGGDDQVMDAAWPAGPAGVGDQVGVGAPVGVGAQAGVAGGGGFGVVQDVDGPGDGGEGGPGPPTAGRRPGPAAMEPARCESASLRNCTCRSSPGTAPLVILSWVLHRFVSGGAAGFCEFRLLAGGTGRQRGL